VIKVTEHQIRKSILQKLDSNKRSEFSDEELEVLSLRWGLSDEQFMTIEQVALKMNQSREDISDIERRALRKLRILAD
jgi:DNA-directed RNA polymerase sigma subunit (sigma70/sigma32)